MEVVMKIKLLIALSFLTCIAQPARAMENDRPKESDLDERQKQLDKKLKRLLEKLDQLCQGRITNDTPSHNNNNNPENKKPIEVKENLGKKLLQAAQEGNWFALMPIFKNQDQLIEDVGQLNKEERSKLLLDAFCISKKIISAMPFLTASSESFFHNKVAPIILCIFENYEIDSCMQNDNGSTLLMSAAEYNNLELVKWLLKHGADTYQKDKNGKIALFLTTDKDCCHAISQQMLKLTPLQKNEVYYSLCCMKHANKALYPPQGVAQIIAQHLCDAHTADNRMKFLEETKINEIKDKETKQSRLNKYFPKTKN